MDAVLCKLHYSVHDQIEVAWICGADYLPYLLERRAHIRGQLRKDLFSVHYPAPIWRGLEASRRSPAASKIYEGGMSDFANVGERSRQGLLRSNGIRQD